jgi:serine protease
VTRIPAALAHGFVPCLPISVAAGSLLVAITLAAPARAADPVADPDGVTPQPSVVAPDQDGWTQVTDSVTADPRTVVREVAAREHAAIVTVTATSDGPAVDSQRVAGRQEAVAAVEAAQSQPRVLAVGVDERVTASVTHDPLNAKQWSFGALHVTQAWPTSTGQGVIVAVVDSGVDGTHPDLAASLVPGFNARTDRGDGSSAATDGNGHGTHVAGAIAAQVDNGVGVAGIAPRALIMPVKALDDSGSGWVSDVAEGITWAVAHGARVINLSLGSDNSSLIEPAIAYAVSSDVTVVAAAGNDGARVNRYPAALPAVISVGALDSDETRASFSNYSPTVDLTAPGVDILSTVPGGYASYDGTSMASPQVAGVAALLRALVPHGDLTSLLTSTAVDLGTPGRDDFYGYGMPNAAAAVSAACAAAGCSAPAPVATTPPAEPGLTTKAQTMRVPGHVRVAHIRALPTQTRQSVAVKTWRSHTKSKCLVISNRLGTRHSVVGLRPGKCRLTFVVPAKDQYLALRGAVLMRVTR